jgi:hypothetical protein
MRTSVRGFARLRETPARAGGALIVPQSADARIRDRRVREQQLDRRKTTRTGPRDTRPRAKKGDLDAEVVAVAVVHPTGDVPPLGAKRRVAAVIARKRERRAGGDGRIADLCSCRRRDERKVVNKKRRRFMFAFLSDS